MWQAMRYAGTFQYHTRGVVVSVRVLRLMEYTYPDLEAAHEDMSHWQVQNVHRSFRNGFTIRSTVILDPTPFEEPIPTEGEK